MSLLKPRSSPPPQKPTTTNDNSDAAASPPPPPPPSPPEEEDKHHKEILERLTTVESMVSQINGRMTALEEVTRSAQFRVDTNIREIMGHIIRDELSQLAPDDDDDDDDDKESMPTPCGDVLFNKEDDLRRIQQIQEVLNVIIQETKTHLDTKHDESDSDDESEQEDDDPSTLPSFDFDAKQDDDNNDTRRVELESKRVQEIRELLRDYQMSPPKTTRKKELIDMLLSAETK